MTEPDPVRVARYGRAMPDLDLDPTSFMADYEGANNTGLWLPSQTTRLTGSPTAPALA
jgi:hypothetical protein